MRIGTPVRLGGVGLGGNGVGFSTIADSPAGNCVIIRAGTFTLNAQFTTARDGVGNTYTLATQTTAASNVPCCAIFYCANALHIPLGTTISVNGSGNYGSYVISVPGITSVVTPLDKTGTLTGTTGTNPAAITTGTLGQATELIVAVSQVNGISEIFSQDSQFTSITTNSSAMFVGYDIVAATTSVSYQPSWSGSAAFAEAVATFKGGPVQQTKSLRMSSPQSVSQKKRVGAKRSFTLSQSITPTQLTHLAPPRGYVTGNRTIDEQFTRASLDTTKWNNFFGNDAFGRFGNSGNLPSPYSGPNRGQFANQYEDPYPYGYGVNLSGAHLQGGMNRGLQMTAFPNNNFSAQGYVWASSGISSFGKMYLPATGGYVQIIAKLPDSRFGANGALWMLSQDNVAAEIDIMESGFINGATPANQVISSNYHGVVDQFTGDAGVDIRATYHTYGVEYIPGVSLKFYFDHVLKKTYRTSIPTVAYEIIIDLEMFNSTTRGYHSVYDTTNHPGPFTLNVHNVQIYTLNTSKTVSQILAFTTPESVTIGRTLPKGLTITQAQVVNKTIGNKTTRLLVRTAQSVGIKTLIKLAPPRGYTSGLILHEDQFTSANLDTTIWNPYMGIDAFGRFSNSGNLPSPYSGENQPGDTVDYSDPYPYFLTSTNVSGSHLVGGQNSGLQLISFADTNFSAQGYTFASAALSTFGKAYLPRTGGYVQISMKLPDSNFGASAKFLLFSQGNVAGEMDIIASGFLNSPSLVNQVYVANWHGTGGSQVTFDAGVDLSAGFHTYGIEYIPGRSWKLFLDHVQIASFVQNIPSDNYEIVLLLNMEDANTSGYHTVSDAALHPGPFTFSVQDFQIYSLPTGVQNQILLALRQNQNVSNRKGVASAQKFSQTQNIPDLNTGINRSGAHTLNVTLTQVLSSNVQKQARPIIPLRSLHLFQAETSSSAGTKHFVSLAFRQGQSFVAQELTHLGPPRGYFSALLVYEDQFLTTSLDTAKWHPYIGNEQFGRFGNNGALPNPYSGSNAGGLQVDYYDPYPYGYNVSISGPHLTGGPARGMTMIGFPNTHFTGYTWAAAGISTFNLKYIPVQGGYVQWSAKMPDSRNGMWAALWFLSRAGAEIDLIETGNLGPGTFPVNQNMAVNWHGGGSQVNFNTGVDLSAGFHTYGMELRPGVRIKMFFDGRLVATYNQNIPVGANYQLLMDFEIARASASGFHTVADAVNHPGPFFFTAHNMQVYNLPGTLHVQSAQMQSPQTVRAVGRGNINVPVQVNKIVSFTQPQNFIPQVVPNVASISPVVVTALKIHTRSAYPTAPTYIADDQIHRLKTAEVVNNAMKGKINAVARFTLNANSTTTILKDPRISGFSHIQPMPTTQNARTCLTQGIWFSDQIHGQVTVNHTSRINTDQTFTFLIIG